jgi:hypothetical protein
MTRRDGRNILLGVALAQFLAALVNGVTWLGTGQPSHPLTVFKALLVFASLPLLAAEIRYMWTTSGLRRLLRGDGNAT